jgi:hypothetical protein
MKKENEKLDSKWIGFRRVQTISRFLMWACVLGSIFFVCFYLITGLVWLILGAILSPTIFLPYATSAVTFITVMIGKWNEI